MLSVQFGMLCTCKTKKIHRCHVNYHNKLTHVFFSFNIETLFSSSTNGGELHIPFDILNDQDDLLKLLHIIKPNTFIQMLATMLLERKLILLSKSIR